MWLVFKSPNGRKWYAETPSGELAWADQQGLYEWRDGRRINYTGGDRQVSDRRGPWTVHSSSKPHILGLTYAVRQYMRGVN